MMLKVLIPISILAFGIASIAATVPAPPVSDADLQVAYSLCTKRYINRDKSIPDKWQKGYENCDQIVVAWEAKQMAWQDVVQHKNKINIIANGVK